MKDTENVQIAKLYASVSIDQMTVQAASCGGECWDCDSCGGSATH